MDGLKQTESKEPTDDKKPSAEQGNAQASKRKCIREKTNGCEDRGYNNDVVWILVMIAGVSTVTVIYKKRKYE